MSAKWIAAKAWDDANLTGPLLPVKWLLRTFSGIPLAVVLLSFIALYGAVASVPIGLFVLIPTKLFYGLTVLLTIGLFTAVPVMVVRRALASMGRSRAVSFVILFVTALLLIAFSLWMWRLHVWPRVMWVPGPEPTGIRFWPEVVQKYQSVLLRQMPGWEMTEVEFYGWWPMKAALLLFVLNMLTATVRRIELRPLNAGVLSVHTGIVMIAVGSIIYERAKVEGDMVLLRNQRGADFFYDRNIAAIYGWSEANPQAGSYTLPLPGLPRYNPAIESTGYLWTRDLPRDESHASVFGADGPDIRITGVIPYGEEKQEWDQAAGTGNPAIRTSMQIVDADGSVRPLWTRRLIGTSPVEGVLHGGRFLIRYEAAPTQRRGRELVTPFPSPGEHMLMVHVPGASFARDYVVQVGDRIEVGSTGWVIEVAEYQSAEDSLALVTEGYRGAQSSRMELQITSPEGKSFRRSALSLYPERSQDFTPDPAGGPPTRSAPDMAIDITYVDASMTSFTILQPDVSEGKIAVIRREPGGALHIDEAEISAFGGPGQTVVDVSGGEADGVAVRLRLDDYWPSAQRVSRIMPVPWEAQRKDFRGNYMQGWIEVEVSRKGGDGTTWSMKQWLPFNQYLEPPFGGLVKSFDVPGSGRISLMFGRLRHQLPVDEIALADFQMIPYPGTQTPRDYVSTLRVVTKETGPQGENHTTRLNNPYIHRVPFAASEERSMAGNAAAWVFSIFIPQQYKFSQAGWDPQQQQFTILGVGNNPGIYLIATGGILMGLGIPVAFYVKPAILRYRSRKIQEELASKSAVGGASGGAGRPASALQSSEDAALAAKGKGRNRERGKATSAGGWR